MKKQFFLSTMFAFVAAFTMAQAPILLALGIDSNLVTTHSITASATRLSGVGQWHVKMQVQENGTSVWFDGDTSTYGNAVTLVTLSKDSLIANTQYLMRFISYNIDFSDSAISTTQTVWTRQMPQPVSISSATSVSMLPRSGILFTASAVAQPSAFGFGIDYMSAQRVTDTIYFTGNVTDTAIFLLGGPLYAHGQTIFVVKAFDGSSVAYSAPIPAFSDPDYTGPTLTLGAVVKTQDSVNISVDVTSVGNAGNVNLIVTLRDSTGPGAFQTIQPVTTTGTLSFSDGGLITNHWYLVTAIVMNQFALGDTIAFAVKTNNVNNPSATLTVGAIGYTTYTVSATTATNGTWDSSAIKIVYYYEDGMLVDSSTSDTASFTRTLRTEGYTYYGKIKVVNMANLSYTTSEIPITMLAHVPNAVPHIGDLLADDAATVRVTNITYAASAGNTSTIRLLIRILQTGFVDTMMVGAGLTGSGTFPSITYGNCTGGYTTQVTVFDESPAGIVWGNTLQQNMPLPSDPILAGIVQGQVSTTETTLGVHAFGSGEGNDAPTLKLWLYKDNTQIGSTFSTTVNSGMFDYAYSWDNLDPGTEYKVIAEISAVGAAPSSVTEYFWTNSVATGIQKLVSKVPNSNVFVQPVNILGQKLAPIGEYQKTYQGLHGYKGMVLFQILDDDQHPTGEVFKTFIQ